MSDKPFEGWAVLELMGHRRLGGLVTEQEIAGAAFLRIDVPGADGETMASQFYAPGAVYCLTPTTEEMARAVAVSNQPQPVTRWELRALEPPRATDSWAGPDGPPARNPDYDPAHRAPYDGDPYDPDETASRPF